MIKLLNGDCLKLMEDLSDNSIDILIVDLPYGNKTTACKWDICIDMKEYWKQINRICKPDAPMFFFCNIKFGNSLINSNPKNFRYELLWIKNQATGFLNAKKMPMKKVEYVYVFYNKLSKVYTENIAKYHKHKFVKENDINKPKDDVRDYDTIYGNVKIPKNSNSTDHFFTFFEFLRWS